MLPRSSEPLWWSLFSAGGVVAALCYPAMMFLTGMAVPLGWVSAESLHQWTQHPLVRVYLFVIISLPLFHFAHRFRHTAVELGLRAPPAILSAVSYGAAIAGTLVAAIALATGR